MTIAELRVALDALTVPDTTLVVGRGYEDGYDDVCVRVEQVVDTQGPGEKRFGGPDDTTTLTTEMVSPLRPW